MMQREQKFGIGTVQKYLMQQHSNPDQFSYTQFPIVVCNYRKTFIVKKKLLKTKILIIYVSYSKCVLSVHQILPLVIPKFDF